MKINGGFRSQQFSERRSFAVRLLTLRVVLRVHKCEKFPHPKIHRYWRVEDFPTQSPSIFVENKLRVHRFDGCPLPRSIDLCGQTCPHHFKIVIFHSISYRVRNIKKKNSWNIFSRVGLRVCMFESCNHDQSPWTYPETIGFRSDFTLLKMSYSISKQPKRSFVVSLLPWYFLLLSKNFSTFWSFLFAFSSGSFYLPLSGLALPKAGPWWCLPESFLQECH